MQRNLRKLRVAAVFAALTLVAGACGGDDTPSGGGGSAAPSAGAGGDLLLWTGPGPTGEETKKLAKAFGEENGVNVTVQVVPKDLQTQFVTASQAGKAPDVVFGAHDWIGNLVQNGDHRPDPDDRRAPRPASSRLAVKAVTFNGQIYGMPYTMNNIVLFRNTDLAPEAPTTIEDMVATGKELKAAGKVSEIAGASRSAPNGDPYHINPLYTSGGGYMFGTAAERRLRPQGPRRRQAGVDRRRYEKIGALGEKGEGVAQALDHAPTTS